MPSRPRSRCSHCGVEAVRGRIWHRWNCPKNDHKLTTFLRCLRPFKTHTRTEQEMLQEAHHFATDE